MTRAEILESYAVENGVIRSPGQFEGQAIYAPHFWAATLDGTAEELFFMEDGAGEYVALVEIDADDRAEFPEIDAGAIHAAMTQSDSGFISCELCTEERADALRGECEELAAEQDEANEDYNHSLDDPNETADDEPGEDDTLGEYDSGGEKI